ncbi:MAG: BlaI/MecI/CopY family transcriptional regulator [Limisphaerales bacterium]
MPKPKPHRLGDLQLAILEVLWKQQEAPVAAVHEALGGSAEYAYTTIATMLRKMEDRRLVHHRTEGRSFIYRAAVAADDVTRGVADHLVDRLFAGSLADAVSQLLSSREVSRAELDEIAQLIADRKKRL